jgi:hypothetical protein
MRASIEMTENIVLEDRGSARMQGTRCDRHCLVNWLSTALAQL